MTGREVDEYLRTKVQPEHHGIVVALRRLMNENAPDVTEVISYGSLAWKSGEVLAIVSASRAHITFAFSRGAEFEDRHGLLEGVGKTTRHIKFKNQDAIDAAALRDYIGQAVRLDQQ